LYASAEAREAQTFGFHCFLGVAFLDQLVVFKKIREEEPVSAHNKYKRSSASLRSEVRSVMRHDCLKPSLPASSSTVSPRSRSRWYAFASSMILRSSRWMFSISASSSTCSSSSSSTMAGMVSNPASFEALYLRSPGRRSKELVFGVVKFRVATSIVLKVGKEACLKALKALGLTDCIRIKEEVDKEAVDKLLDGVTLAKVGASRKTVDRLHRSSRRR
jgi:hypothetical protein